MDAPVRQIDRYLLYPPIAHGGMATIHLGRQLGAAGTGRIVAIKRLQAAYAGDPEFVKMFLDEARITTGIDHLNVIKTFDVISAEGELMLVMELVRGDSLSRLLKEAGARATPTPLPIVSAIMVGTLEGLHAAHQAVDSTGRALQIVHRDVSPHNILVGTDGIPRIADFGIAKALGRSYATRTGEIKGKLAFMAPEQIRNEHVDRRADVYAASVVLWEALAGERLCDGQDAAVVYAALEGHVRPPSSVRPELPPELDAIVLRGLAKDPDGRFQTALEMAHAIEAVTPPARPRAVGEWVTELGKSNVDRQTTLIHEIMSGRWVNAEEAETKVEQTEPTGTAPGTTAELERHVARAKRLVFVVAALACVLLTISAAIVWRNIEPPREAAGAAKSEATLAAAPAAELDARPVSSHTSAMTITATSEAAKPAVSSATMPSGVARTPAAPSSRVQSTETQMPKPTSTLPYDYEF